jgi:hypothetical protein
MRQLHGTNGAMERRVNNKGHDIMPAAAAEPLIEALEASVQLFAKASSSHAKTLQQQTHKRTDQ